MFIPSVNFLLLLSLFLCNRVETVMSNPLFRPNLELEFKRSEKFKSGGNYYFSRSKIISITADLKQTVLYNRKKKKEVSWSFLIQRS